MGERSLTADELRTLRGVIEASPAGSIIRLPASAVLALLDLAEGRRSEQQEAPHDS